MLSKIINSKYLTVFLVLLGILAFMVMIPCLPGPRSSVNFVISAVLIMFLSWMLAIAHFFWLREKRIGWKRFLFSSFKSAVTCFLISVAFITYQYHFGKMIGGKYYQRKEMAANAKIQLLQYYQKQQEHLKETGKFDLNLHKEKELDTGKFIFGTAKENEIIKRNCPDCLVDENQFKLAAYSYQNEHLVFISIDNNKIFNVNIDD